MTLADLINALATRLYADEFRRGDHVNRDIAYPDDGPGEQTIAAYKNRAQDMLHAVGLTWEPVTDDRLRAAFLSTDGDPDDPLTEVLAIEVQAREIDL